MDWNTRNNFLCYQSFTSTWSPHTIDLTQLSVVSHRLLRTCLRKDAGNKKNDGGSKIKVFTSEPNSFTKVKPYSTLQFVLTALLASKLKISHWWTLVSGTTWYPRFWYNLVSGTTWYPRFWYNPGINSFRSMPRWIIAITYWTLWHYLSHSLSATNSSERPQ